MAILIGLLTFAMVMVCFCLICLVLMQLPKKEAGAGVAFGGAATDALFGAGSGNILTKLTKYFATGFFALAMVLALLMQYVNTHQHSGFRTTLEQQQNQSQSTPITPPPATAPSTAPAHSATPASTNLLLMT